MSDSDRDRMMHQRTRAKVVERAVFSKCESFVAWWKYIRYCVMLNFLFLILVINWTYVSLIIMVDLKFSIGCTSLESEEGMHFEPGCITPGMNYFIFQSGMVYFMPVAIVSVLNGGSWSANRVNNV